MWSGNGQAHLGRRGPTKVSGAALIEKLAKYSDEWRACAKRLGDDDAWRSVRAHSSSGRRSPSAAASAMTAPEKSSAESSKTKKKQQRSSKRRSSSATATVTAQSDDTLLAAPTQSKVDQLVAIKAAPLYDLAVKALNEKQAEKAIQILAQVKSRKLFFILSSFSCSLSSS